MQGPLYTPLVIAVQYGHMQIVHCLLQKGANPNAPAEVCSIAIAKYIVIVIPVISDRMD